MRLGVRGAAVLVVVLLLSGCFWSQPGAGPGRGGHNPFEKKISAETVAGLEEVWTATVDGGDVVRHPITSDKGVHVSVGRILYGFDTETGERLWASIPGSPTPEYVEMGPATFANGVLWSGSGTLFAPNLQSEYVTDLLDPATGEVVGEPGPDGMVDGVVGEGYVLTTGNLISAIGTGTLSIEVRDPEDPSLGWRGMIAFLSGDRWQPLTLGPDFVYQAGEGPPGVDENGDSLATTGVRAYSTKEKPADCPPHEGPPYIGPFTCPTWYTRFEGYTAATSPVLDFGTSTLFVGTSTAIVDDSSDGTMYALDATSGDILWSTSLGAGVRAEPALAEGKLFVPTLDRQLVVLDAETGDVLWQARAGNRLEVQAAVAGGVVFTGAFDGSVHAFDAAGCGQRVCEPLWSDATGSPITGAPAVSQGRLYVGTFDGRLIAYGHPGSFLP